MLIALGGAFAIEGAVWAILPAQTREMYRQVFAAPDRMLHLTGLGCVAFGVILIVIGVKLAAV